MHQPFSIRPAYRADLPQVIQLDSAAFSPYGTAESPEVIRARQQVFPAGFVVAEADGRIIGYGSAEEWIYVGGVATASTICRSLPLKDKARPFRAGPVDKGWGTGIRTPTY